MSVWQWIAVLWGVVLAAFTLLCGWQVWLDATRDRHADARWRAAAAHLEARRAVADDQRNVDMTFAQLTDPAHFGKTGGPA